MQIPEYLVEGAVKKYGRKFYFVYPRREMTETDYREQTAPSGKRLKGYTGVCTACGQWSEFNGFLPDKKHKQEATYKVKAERWAAKYTCCPCCGETVEIMKGWYGKKHLRDRFYLQAWDVQEHDRVVLWEAFVFLDDWDDWEEYGGAKEQTVYDLRHTILTPGSSMTYRWSGNMVKRAATAGEYERLGRTISPFATPISIDYEPPTEVNYNVSALYKSFLAPFAEACKKSDIETAYIADYIIRMNEEPITEFALKAGFIELAEQRVYNSKPNHGTRHIDFTAKSPKKMFRGLKKNNAEQKMKELMKLVKPERVKIEGLEFACKRFIHSTDKPEDIAPFVEVGDNLEIFQECLDFLPAFYAHRVSHYIAALPKGRDARYYRDYLRACNAAGAPLNEQKTAFPADIVEAHDTMTRRQKYLFKPETVEKCKKRHSQLVRQGYEYERDGICAVIPLTPSEIVAEGENLDHCVGGYAEKHCREGCNIIFIRRKGSNKSWFTLEVDPKTREFVQCYGYKNMTSGISGIFGSFRNYDPEVGKFLYHYRRRLTWAAKNKTSRKKGG